MYFVNLGVRYSFLENKNATLSFNYNDVLNSMKFIGYGSRPFVQDFEFNWESNTWSIGLNYRFGDGKFRAKSRKNRDDNTKQGGGFL